MAYAAPADLRALKALTYCLTTITVAAGYKHDMSSAVFRGRNVFGDGDPLPMLSVLEPPTAPEQMMAPAASGQGFGDWDLLIQGFVDDDPANPTDPARMLLADVKMRLAIERRRRNEILVLSDDMFGLLSNGVSIVTDLRFGRGRAYPPDGEISSKAYFWLPVTLSLSEQVDDPYA